MMMLKGSRGRTTNVNAAVDNNAMYFCFEKTFNYTNHP